MKTIITALTLAVTTGVAFAAPQEFDMKDPKGVSHVAFLLDAPLESISGTANGVSGEVIIDKENPEFIDGKIVLATETLHVPNPVMKDHLHGEDWMEIETHETITFEPKKLSDVKQEDNKVTANVTGDLTVKGVTKEVTAPVTATLLEGRLGERNPDVEGDLLVLRGNFKVSRADFGINPKAPPDKVAEDIEITLNLAGASPKE